MTTERDLDFGFAAAHHDDLNERQVQVLALVADGLTNGEIAERLDMTLDGAKWNVSEILTKLGLAKREDAAAYYRWHRSPIRRAGRHARALAFAAVGFAAVGLVATLAAWPNSEEEGTPGAFYLEAVITVDDSWETYVGTNISGKDAETPSDAEEVTTKTVLRQWYEPPDLWRWTIDSTSESHGNQSSVAVFDGLELAYFDPEQTTYSRGEYAAPPELEGLPWFPSSILIGRVPGEDATDFIGTFQTLYEGRLEMSQRPGELDGLPVVLIEQSPVACSGEASLSEGESVVADQNCTGVSKLWLDESRMLIVRSEQWADDEHRIAVAEVTEYQADVHHDPTLFEFVPPEGAVDVTDEPR